MTKYYFDVLSRNGVTKDEHGKNYPDLHAAREDAVASLGELGRDHLVIGDQQPISINIRDAAGTVFITVTLGVEVKELRQAKS
jgi:hypothetical protein